MSGISERREKTAILGREDLGHREVTGVSIDNERAGHLDVVLTTLYVRHGQLVAFEEGQNPDDKEAEMLLKAFEDKLPEWQGDYEDMIASAANVDKSGFTCADDASRLDWDGDAYVLDCRRLRIPTESGVIETRLCVAVCTGLSSTKVWTRVSMSADAPYRQARVGIEQAKVLCPKFRAVANSSVEWGFGRLKELLHKHLPNKVFHEKGIIKVTSLGIWDDDLAQAFERLGANGVTAADVLGGDQKLDERLTSYCQKISSACDDRSLSDYAKRREERGITWFKMPFCAAREDGSVVYRSVLYLMLGTHYGSEILGLAYDDSESGDLTLRSGAALSKVIGPWI